MKQSPKSSDNSPPATRRDFLCSAAVATAALSVSTNVVSRAKAQTSGANSRLGIGFIGTGHRAGAHLGTVNALKNSKKGSVEIVAVCDAYRPRMDQVAKQYGVEKSYMDYRELLDDPNVDVVCISTPDHHHVPQILDAVRAGKDVFCEKPLSHWRQFELVKNFAKEMNNSDRVFQLGTQGMSDSAWHQMKKLIADGLIGQPIHAECGYFRVGDGGERGMKIDDPNAKPGKDLNWEAFLGDSPKRPFDVSRFFRWRMYEDYAGGPATDLYPHSLTPVVDMLGVTMPSMVVAAGGIFRYPEREVPDSFNMLIDYPEKLTVAVLGTQGNSYPGYVGHRGSGHRIPQVRGWDGTLLVRGNEIVFAPVHGCKKKTQTFPIEHAQSLGLHWQNFLECCRSRKVQTWSPADLACHVQTALIMGIQALRDKKVAQFDAEQQKIML